METKLETTNTDFEVRSLDVPANGQGKESGSSLKFLVAGLLFGILLVKSEVISWFRIQEMFRFQEFHMFGVIGSAIAIGMISVWLLKRFGVKAMNGEAIQTPRKEFHKGNIYGGLLFGAGWALTGACPGPIFAQIGTGVWTAIATLASALFGTWVYGAVRKWLPH